MRFGVSHLDAYRYYRESEDYAVRSDSGAAAVRIHAESDHDCERSPA